MKTFLKIIFSLILLVALALVTVYLAYKDVVFEKVRNHLASELSTHLGCPVHIGSLKYVPFQTISASGITFPSPDNDNLSIIELNNITVTPDILSLIKDKQLKTIITVDGLRVGDILCDLTIRTSSHKAGAYKDVFDPSLLDSVSVIEASILSKSFALLNVYGNLTMDNMFISGGKICFTCNGIKYLVDFTALTRGEPGYDISAKSDHLNLQSTVIKNNGTMTASNLTGMFYALRFDLKGELRDYFSPNMSCAFTGTIKTDLEKFDRFPGKIGDFARAHSMSGSLTSTIHFEAEEPALDKCKLDSTISVNNLRIKNFRVKEITGRLSLENGQVNASFINRDLYDGVFTCNLKMDLIKKDLPYTLSLVINNLDFGDLMEDITGKGTSSYGTLNSELFLRGYARISETTEGECRITISDADLGPMPLLTPLFGSVFSAVQNILPEAKKVNINEASADFTIRDRKIMTDNLTFLGKEIYITSEGYMDFDGNLNFAFQNQFRESQEEQDEDWQIFLRNAIVRFGKIMSRAHLRGTIKDPKWEFEYLDPIKNSIEKNIRSFLGTFE